MLLFPPRPGQTVELPPLPDHLWTNAPAPHPNMFSKCGWGAGAMGVQSTTGRGGRFPLITGLDEGAKHFGCMSNRLLHSIGHPTLALREPQSTLRDRLSTAPDILPAGKGQRWQRFSPCRSGHGCHKLVATGPLRDAGRTLGVHGRGFVVCVGGGCGAPPTAELLASVDKRVVGGAGAGIKSTARNGDPSCGCGASPARREGVPVSVAIHPGVLRREMARRGWDATELAKQSRLSQATVSTALAGRPIAAKSVALIAKALQRVPPSEVIDSLILYRTKDVELD